MGSGSTHDHVAYAPLPPENVIVLPVYYQPDLRRWRRRRNLSRCLCTGAAIVSLLAVLVFIFYPSDPYLQLARIHLNHIRVNSSPQPTLDLSFSLVVKVHNRDFFSLNYDSLDVSIGYRGRELGSVRSHGGRVRARGSSYVNASLELNGLEVIHDVIYLIEDLIRGVIPFDTVTMVKGELGVLFFEIPLKAKVSCEVYVNTSNQTIVRQDCYPE
ncbi:hypothetical protein AB3S75_016821 [Citrus x aurantiifolia]